MKKSRLLTILAVAIGAAAALSGCGFGSEDPADQVIVEEVPTETPAPTDTPVPTPTIGPDIQGTTYTSVDRTISFELPDATWGSKEDNEQGIIVESPEEGKIDIVHQTGDSITTIPDTEDMANTLETGAGFVPVEDYEIRSYTRENVNSVEVTTYLVHYFNTEKSEGTVEKIIKYLVSEDQSEVYSITAEVYQDSEELTARVQASVDSIKILNTESKVYAATADSSELQQDTVTAAGGADATQANGGFTEEQLNDTNQTRTIYNDTTGKGFAVTPDGNGNWVDNEGNTYRFADDGSSVYDQNDVYFYYHGEPANVLYMTVE